ncbi:MAG: type III pantothenate kinase [Planctomycetota bacterium]
MTDEPFSLLIAADVGNSAVKLGQFQLSAHGTRWAQDLDRPFSDATITAANREATFSPETMDSSVKPLETWLTRIPSTAQCWYATSVNGPLERKLASWVRGQRPQDQYVVLRQQDFPLKVDVRFPERVGTDRLAAAVAANALREPARPAIVIDAGTAITIDAVGADGLFLGGVILPGLEAAAAALANATDALPRVQPREFSSPPVSIGKSTAEAIQAGIIWGSVGAIREHVARMTAELSTAPEIHCTGQAGGYLVGYLGRDFKYNANLVLRGIALTGLHRRRSTENDQVAGDPK